MAEEFLSAKELFFVIELITEKYGLDIPADSTARSARDKLSRLLAGCFKAAALRDEGGE
jgi:hypothetical protein